MNLQRTEILLGSEQLQKIKNSCILVFGVGGVGGYAVEMLARCGVNVNAGIAAAKQIVGYLKDGITKFQLNK